MNNISEEELMSCDSIREEYSRGFRGIIYEYKDGTKKYIIPIVDEENIVVSAEEYLEWQEFGIAIADIEDWLFALVKVVLFLITFPLSLLILTIAEMPSFIRFLLSGCTTIDISETFLDKYLCKLRYYLESKPFWDYVVCKIYILRLKIQMKFS